MQLFPPGKTRPEPHAPLTLGELRLLIPFRPHRTTLDAWCNRGVAGVTLKHEWHGGRRYTCLAWYDEFSKAIAETRQ